MKNLAFTIKHNRIIRNLLKPVMELKGIIREKQFSISPYPTKIEQYKNMYKGKRCFVIGNGPSLTPEDLNRIKGEYSFAANRIYNIFDQTEWRPTFFMSTDMDIMKMEKNKIVAQDFPVMFLNYDAKSYFGDRDNTIYLFLKGPFELIRNKFVQKGVSDDVAKYSTKTQTVTCVSLELAMYMGFSEIYLLGVDHNFDKVVGSDGKLVEDKNVQSYFAGMKGGDSQAVLYLDDTTACYKVVKDYADKHNVKIYNATRGGKLEVYSRVKLEDIL